MDSLASFLRQPTARRTLLVVLFAGGLLLFQHLLPMLAAYAVFVRLLAYGARLLRARTGLSEGRAALVVAALLTTLCVAALLGVWVPAAGAIAWLQTNWRGMAELERQLLTNPQVAALVDRLGGIEGIEARFHDEETLSHLGAGAAAAFSSGKAVLVEGVMAFFLALLYVIDRDEVHALVDVLPADGVPRTLLRWVGFVGDAFALTVQLQFVVALCNTVLTLPVLIGMGVPNVGAMMVFTFVAGLVPVVGNYASAVVLCALAWSSKGWIGVPVFLGLAVLLGKLESFYLTPRLASQHVKVPAFVLTLSLVIFEVQLGFVGLFLSFPFLYVLAKIVRDLGEVAPLLGARHEDAA
jgi:predicted PurR-regulated permease PerM